MGELLKSGSSPLTLYLVETKGVSNVIDPALDELKISVFGSYLSNTEREN